MKTTGMIRQLDALGRVVLPIELRRTLDINTRDMLEILWKVIPSFSANMNRTASSAEAAAD